MAKIHDREVDDHLARAVDIDPAQLEAESRSVASDASYYGARYADAHGEYRRRKAERERLYGELISDPEFTGSLKEELQKAPNLDQIKGAILNDDSYMDALEAEIRADVARIRAKRDADSIMTKARQLEVLARVSRDWSGSGDGVDEDEGDDD